MRVLRLVVVYPSYPGTYLLKFYFRWGGDSFLQIPPFFSPSLLLSLLAVQLS